MKLYNSLTNKIEEFKPLNEGKVNMYVCGPTVYNYVHIGNAMPIIIFDVLKRYLLYKGFEVKFISNITDVDDKIIKAAITEGITEKEIAKKYTNALLEDINQLNVLPYEAQPKVTENMEDIINFIENMVDAGYAYEVNGNVYFRVNKVNDYGILSGQKIENLEVGARIEENTDKESPFDFALWKKTNEGIKWNSPWGEGRPGWHTECVVMINKNLGREIDIHGGGIDLRFPHHENEIAQSKALFNNNIARYWMHNGSLNFGEEKMSKSLGNVIRLRDFLKEYSGNVLRMIILMGQYRQPLSYTQDVLNQSMKELEKIENAFKQINLKLDMENYLDKIDSKSEIVKALEEEFDGYLEDDLNTPNALMVIQKYVKEINKIVRTSNNKDKDLMVMNDLFYSFYERLNILGIDIEIIKLDEEVKELIKQRDEARKNKDFETADKIRSKLNKLGINVR